MPVVNHDGAGLFYRVEGNGPPLLLIMGLGYPSDMWWRMLPWLTSHFTTVRFDNQGVGRTGTGAERPELRNLTPACGQRKARGTGRAGVSTVIHFSTITPVHSCAAADQRVYRNHPQAYTQDANLAPPGLA
jgi:pimeloyl-ACP methyl ester carboxylesterase